MCGIVGFIHRGGDSVDRTTIERSADLLFKRGPDDAGSWTENEIGLGHRRLSILDVTPAGHQPMVSEDGRFVIVYNGEVYNFRDLRRQLNGDSNRWKSNSDTEVILAAFKKWGTDCVRRFHGMFAFAVWDRRERTLFAARDRMGVKPFYYHNSPEMFAFASRPRALFALSPLISRDLDEQALRFYMECGYIPSEFSIYRDVRKLPPAHYLILNEKGIRLERYWEFRHIEPDLSWKARDENNLLDELEEIASRCVRSRMISDVPLGVFLSGGIDSTLVAGLMARYSTEPVKTFTIGFREKSYDESARAEAVARHLGTEHTCEHLALDELLNLMPTFVGEYDEPFFDSSALPTLAVSRLARTRVTVSLSGDGGDELFGGYHYYRILTALDGFYSFPEWARSTLGALIDFVPEHRFKLLSAALRQQDRLSSFAFSRSISKDFDCILSDGIQRRTLGIRDIFLSASEPFPAGLSIVEQAMRLDAFFTLPDDYLQKVDVASMAFSLESREPLLDHEIVEWAMKLPLSYKIRGNQTKYLLKKLAFRLVPEAILDGPKHGFEVPLAQWLRGPLKKWAEDRFNNRTSFERIPLDQGRILELFRIHTKGERNAHPLLWAALMLIEFDQMTNARGGRPGGPS